VPGYSHRVIPRKYARTVKARHVAGRFTNWVSFDATLR
jgi:hypothetical protein